MKRIHICAVAFALLAACDAPTPAERSALQADAMAARADILQTQARPAIRACVGYASGAPLDVARLQQAGFTGPSGALSGVSFRAPDLFVVVQENRGLCRMTWLGSVSPRSTTAALRDTLAAAGFTQTGRQDGRDVFYSNGPVTLSAASVLTTTGSIQAIDVILKRQ
ncbi:hypothetical protein [Pseudooctadecabacter jejudonensis]|uniref:Lipoprotein n=1 Tax=Pseudooctadecabacter jejudonensis TaxID=1391910 RepID=A0A1Y5RH73_9RHOB|nr:hypothetical protein [Pseudooctadecabacter jejudonensis]SLN14766.1 hypothetical protein PSJ8397_00301 [Pseudooctadecabacter jejudonensis]